jgi:citrate synthase
MADETLFKPGLEGVVAFESEIAEPDKEGSALRYRGVDIEELVGNVSFGNVWGLLVDGKFNPGLPPPSRSRCRCTPATSASTCSPPSRCSAPAWGLQQMLDIDVEQIREDLARVSVMTMAFVAQSARGLGKPMVPQSEVDKAETSSSAS